MANSNLTMRYYRASTPAARAAWVAYSAQCDAIVAEAKAFAEHFPGSSAVYSSGATGRSFYGLRFETPMPLDVWTKPIADEGSIQRPRSRLAFQVGTDRVERLAELRRVQSIFFDYFPKGRARLDPVFEALGTDWGTLLLYGYRMFERESGIYVATSLDLGAPCDEITGGEFSKAEKVSGHV